MFCQKCGASVEGGATVCQSCGADITDRSEKSVDEQVSLNKNCDVREKDIDEMKRSVDHFSQKRAEYNEYDNVVFLVGQMIKIGKRHSLLIWGIILLVLNVAGLSMGGKLLSFFPGDKERLYSAICIALFVANIIGSCLLIGSYVVYTIRRNRHYEYCVERLSSLTGELNRHYHAYGECPLAADYTNPSNLIAVLELLESGGANSIKEALAILTDKSERRLETERKSFAEIEEVMTLNGNKLGVMFYSADIFY